MWKDGRAGARGDGAPTTVNGRTSALCCLASSLRSPFDRATTRAALSSAARTRSPLRTRTCAIDPATRRFHGTGLATPRSSRSYRGMPPSAAQAQRGSPCAVEIAVHDRGAADTKKMGGGA